MLYIMRHGKTDWNIQHKLQGRTDIPLNEEGRQMAKQAREDYLNIPIDICYCSPLIRARETAELVLQGRNIPILYDDRLIEMGFGIYEGTANCEDIPDCPVGMLFRHPEQYIARDGGREYAGTLGENRSIFKRNCISAAQRGKKHINRWTWCYEF